VQLGSDEVVLSGLVDVLAASLIVSPEERERLFETADLGSRVEGVSAGIARLLAELAKRSPLSN
jgi:hypothetical protein